MTRISLQTLDQVLAAQQRAAQAGEPGGGLLARLSPGEIIQARVLKSLGDSLFQLSIGGKGVVTSSNTPLTPGQVLSLQVSSNGQGPPSLRVLTLADGAIADVAEKSSVENLEQHASPQILARLVPTAAGKAGLTLEFQLPDSPSTQASAAPTVASPLSARLTGLIKPDGPVARLLAERPDLAGRVQQLLERFQQEPQGLGVDLEKLTRQLDPLVRTQPRETQTALSSTGSRLSSQLFSSQLFEQPEALAQVLADRLGRLASGFENAVAKWTQPMESTQQATNAAPNAAALVAEDAVAAAVQQWTDSTAASQDVESLPPGLSPSPSGPPPAAAEPPSSAQTPTGWNAAKVDLATRENTQAAPHFSTANSTGGAGDASAQGSSAAGAAEAGRVVQGTLQSDLKGQLLELRTQLSNLAAQSGDSSPALTQAIAQTDVMLNQITAQQIRNLDGLNQYMHVELPISPKGGVDAARMQVFYRKRGEGQAQDVSEDRFTVALFLGMSQLGKVMAVLTKVDQSISVGFTVGNPQTRELLSSQSDALREALLSAGHVGATVTVRQADARPTSAKPAEASDVWQEFLTVMPPAGSPGRRLNVRA